MMAIDIGANLARTSSPDSTYSITPTASPKLDASQMSSPVFPSDKAARTGPTLSAGHPFIDRGKSDQRERFVLTNYSNVSNLELSNEVKPPLRPPRARGRSNSDPTVPLPNTYLVGNSLKEFGPQVVQLSPLDVLPTPPPNEMGTGTSVAYNAHFAESVSASERESLWNMGADAPRYSVASSTKVALGNVPAGCRMSNTSSTSSGSYEVKTPLLRDSLVSVAETADEGASFHSGYGDSAYHPTYGSGSGIGYTKSSSGSGSSDKTKRVRAPKSMSKLRADTPTKSQSNKSPSSIGSWETAKDQKETVLEWGLPSVGRTMEAGRCNLMDEDGRTVRFSDLLPSWPPDMKIQDREGATPPKLVVFFIGHWWCGQYHDYISGSVASLSPEAIAAANVRVILVSTGSWKAIKQYRKLFNCPFPIYSDPGSVLSATLEIMEIPPNPFAGAFDKGRPSYHSASGPKQIVKGLATALTKLPLSSPGRLSDLGGEFIFRPDYQCEFAHRMKKRYDHIDAADVLRAAGVKRPTRSEILIHTHQQIMSLRKSVTENSSASVLHSKLNLAHDSNETPRSGNVELPFGTSGHVQSPNSPYSGRPTRIAAVASSETMSLDAKLTALWSASRTRNPADSHGPPNPPSLGWAPQSPRSPTSPESQRSLVPPPRLAPKASMNSIRSAFTTASATTDSTNDSFHTFGRSTPSVRSYSMADDMPLTPTSPGDPDANLTAEQRALITLGREFKDAVATDMARGGGIDTITYLIARETTAQLAVLTGDR